MVRWYIVKPVPLRRCIVGRVATIPVEHVLTAVVVKYFACILLVTSLPAGHVVVGTAVVVVGGLSRRRNCGVARVSIIPSPGVVDATERAWVHAAGHCHMPRVSDERVASREGGTKLRLALVEKKRGNGK